MRTYDALEKNLGKTPPRPDLHPPRVNCPTCGDRMGERITGSSKVNRVLLTGVFAIPFAGQTFECKSCGYRW